MIHIENTTIEEQIAYEKEFAEFCLERRQLNIWVLAYIVQKQIAIAHSLK